MAIFKQNERLFMIKLKQIAAEEDRGIVKATIQKSGRFGFSLGAINELVLEDKKSISIFVNEDDSTDNSLYIKVNEEKEEDAFTVKKAGIYYYLNTKTFFDKLNVNYQDKSITIIFDIIEFDNDGENYFKLIRRDKKRY